MSRRRARAHARLGAQRTSLTPAWFAHELHSSTTNGSGAFRLSAEKSPDAELITMSSEPPYESAWSPRNFCGATKYHSVWSSPVPASVRISSSTP